MLASSCWKHFNTTRKSWPYSRTMNESSTYVQLPEGKLPLLVPGDAGGSSFLPASRPCNTYFERPVMVPVMPLAILDVPQETSLLKLAVQAMSWRCSPALDECCIKWR